MTFNLTGQFRPICRERSGRVTTSWVRLINRPDVRLWLTRELQALLLEEDVSIVQGAILPEIRHAPQVRTLSSTLLSDL